MNSKIYRCKYCGEITDEFGTPLDGNIRQDAIDLIESNKDIETIQTYGECCLWE